MFPKYHIFFGIIFSIILFIIFPEIKFFGFLIIFSSNVLVDVDHYLYYVFKKNDWSLKNAREWFYSIIKKYNSLSNQDKKKVYYGVFFLHGIEFLIILFILSFYHKIFLFIFIGFIFHEIIDLVDLLQKRINPYKVISFGYSLYKTKDKLLIDEYKNG